MNRSQVFAAVALALVVVSGVGGVALAAGGQDDSGSSQYTIEELKQDGKHYQGPPSIRIVPSQHKLYYLEHRPVNQPWAQVSPETHGKKLDGLLKTNTLFLRTTLATSEPVTKNVTVVYWNKETRPVEVGNTTRQEAYAANVSVVHKSVTLNPGMSVAEISLPQHDETTRVTMWLDDHPDQARWTFSHKSVAFTQPLDTGGTWSGFLMLSAGFIILPALIGGAWGGKKVRSWIRKAGAPPGHGFAYYIVATTTLTGVIVFGVYYKAAEVIVTIPVVLGLYVAAVYVGYMLATHEGKTSKKVFFQPHIESVEAFTQSKLPTMGAGNSDKSLSFSEDMPFGQMRSYDILDEGQRGLSIVRGGWMAFLARLKGGRAKIENADELKTRFSLFDSFADEAFIVDPKADTLVDYQPPGLRLKTPEIDTWSDLVWPVTILGGGGLVAWQAAQVYGATAWALILVGVPFLVWKFAVTGTDSYVHVEPAPAALRPVIASMLVMQIGYKDATKLKEAEDFAWRALAGQETEERSWESRRDDSYVRETGDPTPTADRQEDTAASEEPASKDSEIDRVSVGGDDD